LKSSEHPRSVSANTPGDRLGRPFDIEVEQNGDTALIRLYGEFDLASKASFEESLRDLPLERIRELTFDLRSLTFIDSTGLQLILQWWRHSQLNGFDLAILPGRDHVQRVFAVTGLEKVLPIIGDPPSAAADARSS
jgi:anti-sigma B factor antagonist